MDNKAKMAIRIDISSPIPAEFTQKQGQDQLHDANFALMELEKGLRSSKPGEQCEAIVHVPALVAKYPFPILVNSAFLKLADVFRGGSNFMKLCVLKAIQSSKRHLDKIFNVDEFCRRFFAVIHSNDPIARAVTLRVFGNISPIIAERKNIHHSIRNSLDSHDTNEVEAAIFATKCFAEVSSSFAAGLFQKVADMIKGLATPIEMKLKLLPVFKFMYHDVKIANQVSGFCGELLQSYPSHMFISAILNTGTELAVATLINIDKQVKLLLKYLTEDPRKSVQMIAVKNLFSLAKKAPHLWKEEYVDKLVSVALECLHVNIRQRILHVVRVLALDEGSVHVLSSNVLDQLEELSMDMCVDISSLALESRIRAKCAKKHDLDTDSLAGLVSDLEIMISISISENSLPSLKRCLSCAEKLILESDNHLSLNDFLVECLLTVEGETFLEVCHTLVSLSTYKGSLCFDHIDNLLALLVKQINASDTKQERNILVALFTLIMQSPSKHAFMQKLELQDKLLGHIETLHEKQDFWTLYRIGRQASRLRYPLVASKVMDILTTKVSSENFYFWFKALHCFNEAEAVLFANVNSLAKLQKHLMSSHNHYQEGLTNLKAAVTTDHPLYFQFKFSRLRADMLRAYSQLLTCCSSLRLNPPPSLARSSSLATGKEVHHLSRLASQFQSSAAMFNNVAMGYQSLYKSSFNCDKTTLQNIQLLQESCQVISYAIETLVLLRCNERVCPEFQSGQNTEVNEYLKTVTDTNLEILRNVQEIDSETKDMPISHRQINYLANIVVCHLKIGFSYPLYFFKSRQNTSLQLSITPGNALPDNPYLVNITHDMALKIEGVITDKGIGTRFRHPNKVNIVVKVKPSTNARNAANDIKPIQMTEMVFKESAKPRSDYFSTQFLLSFKYLGHHTVKVIAGIEDDDRVDWDTGPSFMIHVEVHEQGHHKRR